MPADTAVPPIVEMRGITIRFPGVLALDGVDFSLRAGEVHSLMGENGAGKSTLIKALTGVYAVDAGSIDVDRRGAQSSAAPPTRRRPASRRSTRRSTSARTSRSARTSCSATSRARGGGIDWKAAHREAARHLQSLGLAIDTRSHALEPLDRHPAARRDQPRDGARRQGADPRRADLEPGPRRGRAAVRGDPRPARPAASPSSSSATSSIRSTRSPTASRCCATASSSASTASTTSLATSWSRR